MASLATIKDWIANRLPAGYFDDVLTDAELTNLVNEAQREACRRHNFAWMKRECTQSTVDGQQRYSLPDGTQEDGNGVRVWRFKQDIAVELVDSGGQVVPLTSAYKIDLRNDPSFADTGATGAPTHYAIDHGDIWLFAPPGHADNGGSAWTLRIEYYGYPPDLSDALTDDALTDSCDDLLKYGGLARALEVGEDFDKAAYWQAKFETVLGHAVAEDLMAAHGPIETGLVPTDANALGRVPCLSACPPGWGGIVTRGGYVDES